VSVGGGAAAAAAAADARRRAEEEEEMTRYTGQDLTEGWEFKILRSATGAFKHSARLTQVLAEEGRAGWVLVEKFDNGRIRLKRRVGSHLTQSDPGFDPYRTYVGISEWQLVLWIVGVVFGIVGVGLLIALNM
jgi:hypothetical protein